jgi:hypothetical protein
MFRACHGYVVISFNIMCFSLIAQGMFPLKAFYWGHLGARNNYSLQIRNLKEEACKSLGNIPVIFGECGIPMDMK